MKSKTITNLLNPIVVSLMLIPILGIGQNTAKKITIKEAVVLSLQNNKQLKIDNSKIDEANASVIEANERKKPESSVSATYLLLNSPHIGGNLKLGGSDSSHKSSPAISQVALLNFSISKSIFNGGQIKYGIESSNYLAQAKKMDAEFDKQAIILNTLNALHNLYDAFETVQLIQKSLLQQKERVKDFTNLEKNGLLARNDLLKASLQKSNVELSLLEAQSSLNVANINTDILLGLPETTQLEIDTSGFNATLDNKTMLDWETLALQNRKDIASLQWQKKASDAGLKIIEGEKLPSVALTGGYVNAYVQNIITVTNAINVGVSAKYNIGNLWKTDTKMLKAKAQQQQLIIYQDILNDNIRLEITKAYEDYYLSIKKLDVYENAIQQADENYRITNNKYKNGLATLTDLLDADVANLKAKLQQILAKSDVGLAYIKLQKTAGVLTENF